MRRRSSRRRLLVCSLTAIAIGLFSIVLFADTVWIAQGPSPSTGGQSEGVAGGNPVSGAVQGIAPDPTNANTLYVATVNGGVWKTTNAQSVPPTWTPLTDTALPSNSMASIAV